VFEHRPGGNFSAAFRDGGDMERERKDRNRQNGWRNVARKRDRLWLSLYLTFSLCLSLSDSAISPPLSLCLSLTLFGSVSLSVCLSFCISFYFCLYVSKNEKVMLDRKKSGVRLTWTQLSFYVFFGSLSFQGLKNFFAKNSEKNNGNFFFK
jgi:hypothetical protein